MPASLRIFDSWGKTISKSAVSEAGKTHQQDKAVSARVFNELLTEDLLYNVLKPGQYLGNEWGAARREFGSAEVRLCLGFPDIYELGMSNFGLRILYQIVNSRPEFMCDRTYAPGTDLEVILRERNLPLWGWESRHPLAEFELVGFSLAYELTYTNVLNMLDISGIPVVAAERTSVFPLMFGGGPSSVNPEPMSKCLDFFLIGDGEEAIPATMDVVRKFKAKYGDAINGPNATQLRTELLTELARNVSGLYVPSLYEWNPGEPVATPKISDIPSRVPRQVQPLNDQNQPAGELVPYLTLVHDRQVLEVRRGCDRGCRFCQPGYTFLPVRERTTEDLVRLSKEALDKSGYQEYSLLSLCVSDYTSLYDTVRALNREHTSRRASMSFPSQRADRMNLDVAEELKAVRKSGITLAPEAGTERMRAVINKGLSHEQIINAITSAYESGWQSIKLYYMIGLPTEREEDLQGIVETLVEATVKCDRIRKANPEAHKGRIEFTCTLSNTVPKPFTPFQWYGQPTPEQFQQKHETLRTMLRASGLRNVKMNFTDTQTSMLEAVISRGNRRIADLVHLAWEKGCTFDAWDDRLKAHLWHEAAAELGINLIEEASADREVGSRQPWDVVNVGLADWWLANEWKKAMEVKETAPCSENTCHACGICTDLDVKHELANPDVIVLGKNPFVKAVERKAIEPAPVEQDVHPSLFVQDAPEPPPNKTVCKLMFEFKKTGELKFIGHLDLQHLLIRAARRAQIFVSYSEGFNPGPKLSLALSLALYQEGLAEAGELELSEELSPEEFVRRMNAQLPPEVQILRARTVEKSNCALAQVVGRATYTATLTKPSMEKLGLDADSIQSSVNALNEQTSLDVQVTPSAKSLRRQRSGKRSPRNSDERKEPSMRDIKPGIYSLQVVDNSATVRMELAHGPRLHIKPSEILKLIAEDADWRITRVGLATENGIPLFDHC